MTADRMLMAEGHRMALIGARHIMLRLSRAHALLPVHHSTRCAASCARAPQVLKAARGGVPPDVKLDGAYKFVDGLYELIPHGAPSLINCTKLVVDGAGVSIAAGVTIEGKVTVKNASGGKVVLKPGKYANQEVSL